jgi:hypothetical protein
MSQHLLHIHRRVAALLTVSFAVRGWLLFAPPLLATAIRAPWAYCAPLLQQHQRAEDDEWRLCETRPLCKQNQRSFHTTPSALDTCCHDELPAVPHRPSFVASDAGAHTVVVEPAAEKALSRKARQTDSMHCMLEHRGTESSTPRSIGMEPAEPTRKNSTSAAIDGEQSGGRASEGDTERRPRSAPSSDGAFAWVAPLWPCCRDKKEKKHNPNPTCARQKTQWEENRAHRLSQHCHTNVLCLCLIGALCVPLTWRSGNEQHSRAEDSNDSRREHREEARGENAREGAARTSGGDREGRPPDDVAPWLRPVARLSASPPPVHALRAGCSPSYIACVLSSASIAIRGSFPSRRRPFVAASPAGAPAALYCFAGAVSAVRCPFAVGWSLRVGNCSQLPFCFVHTLQSW